MSVTATELKNNLADGDFCLAAIADALKEKIEAADAQMYENKRNKYKNRK